MYFVYVLESTMDGKRYTGMTNDLKRRIAEHNRGKASAPSTRSRRPFKLLYSETAADRLAARKREKFLKSGAGREFLQQHIPR